MKIKDIIFNSSLYSKWENHIEIRNGDEVDSDTLDSLISEFNDLVEIFCLECNANRMYAAERGKYDTGTIVYGHLGGHQTVRNKPSLYKSFSCSASPHHKRLFGFLVDGDYLVKIAEYPSKYDTVKDKFNKYETLIGKQKIKELGKASQLESFGYPIAAFLFYRRLFETIIFNTFKDAHIADKIEEKAFRVLRMEEKVDYIKDFLPDYFLQNTFMYGVLSKGIHELEEPECREYLEVIKTVIFFSLDETLDKRKEENRKKEFANKLKNIKSKMS